MDLITHATPAALVACQTRTPHLTTHTHDSITMLASLHATYCGATAYTRKQTNALEADRRTGKSTGCHKPALANLPCDLVISLAAVAAAAAIRASGTLSEFTLRRAGALCGGSALESDLMTAFLNAYSTITTPVDDAPQSPCSTRTVVDSSGHHPHLATTADAQAELEHLAQFDDFIWRQVAGYTNVSSNVLALSNHVRRTRWHYVFEVTDDFSPTDLAPFHDWAERANAIFVLPDLSVFSADGLPLPAAAKPPRPARAVRQMAQVRRILWDQGVRIPENLPAASSDDEIILRRPSDIVERAQALVCLSQATVNIVSGFPAARSQSNFSPAEQRFMDTVHTTAGAYSPELQKWSRDNGPFAMGAAETLTAMLGLGLQGKKVEFPNILMLQEQLTNPIVSLDSLQEIAHNLEYSSCLRWWDIEHPQSSDYSNLLLGRIYALLWATNPMVDWDDVQVNI